MALRLAIIEDNADLLDELLAWLGYRGFEVWGSRSAEAFWRQLHSHPVDIVLIDIGLPGEDGFSVLSYLHELGHYGLVVVSARGQQQDKLQAPACSRIDPPPFLRRRPAPRHPPPQDCGVYMRIN